MYASRKNEEDKERRKEIYGHETGSNDNQMRYRWRYLID
jgi:hypothetical protein